MIFDEASEVRPHDAVCAVYHGRQLVVAGEPKQLPPTDFFARSAADDPDADDGEEGTAGFESLLDVCLSLGLVRKRLRWHYRSRREGLIAFSNRFFYGNDLVTFPSVDDGTDPAVRFAVRAGGVRGTPPPRADPPQAGRVRGFRIDMAVVDPAAGGRYLLGVECDGATYHSSATARDRDRPRQAVLEGLGWRLCRVWSTDWLRNREKQVQRVLRALDAVARPPAVQKEEPPPKPADPEVEILSVTARGGVRGSRSARWSTRRRTAGRRAGTRRSAG